MATAATTVFVMPELLEIILLLLFLAQRRPHIPISPDSAPGRTAHKHALLRCQLVNRTFKATTDASPKLQEVLFFRGKRSPAPPPTNFGARHSENVNQLFFDRSRPLRINSSGGTIDLRLKSTARPEAIVEIRHKRKKVNRSDKPTPIDGSWRFMLLVHPLKIPVAIVWISDGWSLRCKYLSGRLEYEHGVKLGEVVDHCLEWERQDTTRGQIRLSELRKIPAIHHHQDPPSDACGPCELDLPGK
ncbi:hypothetical protein LTR78_002052 [Recurvomyces mirabilis]|uniref:Uncharacterized protein n=1 Tax=Recurvomyces mirabilis TaxID=574656 RepID=A0AAE1C4N4_9PEZI|nr:hypothetical protein LTR78_002052 [Recurvomyces mirabilis]KAK5160510.1 hypothetical protein LTS14_001522 [Recurvomyces mirabilis]